MKLRTKTLLTTSLILLLSVIILNLISRAFLLRSYLDLEHERMDEELRELQDQLDSDFTNIGRSNAAMGYWNQTVQFIQAPNQRYIDENFYPEMFPTLDVNLVMLFDTSGNLIFSRAVDLDTLTERSIPDELSLYLKPDSPLLHHDEHPEAQAQGIMMLRNGPVLITAGAILPDTHELPIRGTSLMGRFLDAQVVQDIANKLHLDVTIFGTADAQAPLDVLKVKDLLALSKTDTVIQPLSETMVAGYRISRDPEGNPTVIWRIVMPRKIYAQGLQSVTYFLGAALVVGLLFTVLSLIGLEQLILSRLGSLHRSVSAIRHSGDLTQRLKVFGDDELSELAAAINDLIRELDTAQASLKRALQLKSDMLANVSHDARSPLSTIQLRAEMLLQGVKGPLNEAQQQSVENIVTSAQRLLSFVNNLLDASRLEAGSTSLNCRDFPIANLIQEITTTMRPQAQSKGLGFQTIIDDDVPSTLYGDPQRLAQVLSNLVGNAIKFTDQGQVSIALHHTAQNNLRIEVTDTGRGIPLEEQSHVFEAFYQVDRSMTRRDMQGVGLGLSIVKEITDLMGGTATVQSEPGVGSTFIVEVPLAQSRKG